MKQDNYIIGLDLGINNIGWSILNFDTKKIEKCGVRLFNESSSAQDRREARNVRRRLKRQKLRVKDTLKLFNEIGFTDKPTVDSNLLEKRIKGMSSKLGKIDIINVVKYHMTHRGYIAFDDDDVEFIDLKGKYPCEYYYDCLDKDGKYRAQFTVSKGNKIDEVIKNSEIKRELIDFLDRQSKYYPELEKIKDKIITVFSRKREFWQGPGSINSLTPFGRFKTKSDVEEYLSKKSSDASYEKYIYEDLIGKSKVKNLNEICAPRANFYAEKFNMINDFINIQISDISHIDPENMKYFDSFKNYSKLNKEGIEKVFDYCLNTIKGFNQTQVFNKLFGITSKELKGYRIDKNNKMNLSTMNIHRLIFKEFSSSEKLPNWLLNVKNDCTLYNKIIFYINVIPNTTLFISTLENDKNFADQITKDNKSAYENIYKKIKREMQGYHSLSESALKSAISDMLKYKKNFQQIRSQLDYDQAYFDEIYNFYDSKKNKIPLLTADFIDEIIASPQVKKTLRQSIKVINDIIKEKKTYPEVISIESTKEVNGAERKKEIDREQRILERLKKEAKETIIRNGKEPNTSLINRVMYYEEVNGICPYCNKTKIDLGDVLREGVLEVDHILPISKTGNDSFNNKIICCKTCNDNKKNRTPYAWMGEGLFKDFKERVKANKNFSDEKKQNLLFEGDVEKYKIRFFNRNLRDTAYATTELVNQIKLFNIYLFRKNNIKIKTFATPGQFTHKLREKYGLDKNRDIGYFHHAVDACLVAGLPKTFFGKKVLDMQNMEENWKVIVDEFKKDDQTLNLFSKLYLDPDYKRFIDNIDSDDKIYISRQINKNPQGKLSNANIVKYIKKEDNYYKVDQINNIYEETPENLNKVFGDKPTVKLMIEDNNPKLYNHLKQVYEEYKSLPGNPFKNYCFDIKTDDNFKEITDFKPLKHGIKVSKKETSPVVIKLRYYSKVSTPLIKNKHNIKSKDNTYYGYDSISQYCTEVYYNRDKNKFAFLPIYSVSIDLKTKKINRNDSFYKVMYDKYVGNANIEFITQLFNNNYLVVEKASGEFVSGVVSHFDKTNNKISFKEKTILVSDNNSSKELQIVKKTPYLTVNDKAFYLYDVDTLGNRQLRLTYKIK